MIGIEFSMDNSYWFDIDSSNYWVDTGQNSFDWDNSCYGNIKS